MGGSLSQPRTDPPVSSINGFFQGDLYTPQLSDSFPENTGYWQQPNPDDSLVEQVATSSTKKKNATRNRQKRVNQAEPAPRQTAWTTEEEIAFAKGWRSVSKNSKRGNARKKFSFWVEVLEYVESKTKKKGNSMTRGQGQSEKLRSKASGSSTMNDDALVRLMVTEMTATEVAQRGKFMDLKMRESVELLHQSVESLYQNQNSSEWRVVDLLMSELKELKQVASVKEYHDSFIDVLNRLQHPQRSIVVLLMILRKISGVWLWVTTNVTRYPGRIKRELLCDTSCMQDVCLSLDVDEGCYGDQKYITVSTKGEGMQMRVEMSHLPIKEEAASNVKLQLQEPWQFDRDSIVKVHGDECNFDITQSDIIFFANLFVMEDGIEFLIREHANIEVPLAKSNKHRQSSSDLVAALIAENFEWKPGLEFWLVEKGRKIHGLLTYSLEVGLIKNKLETVNKWLVK
uniref:Uncharacterized protein n=1 Tax=Tanacetum cinerariifolium TaxID=118510 RepID=A0A699H9N6_TANCI|nr:hypothetical protein [Tanacetum cinerariifolium]